MSGTARARRRCPPFVFPRHTRWEYDELPGLIVRTQGLPAEYRSAFLRILGSTRDYYRKLFGRGVIDRVEFSAWREKGASPRLWTNGADRIYLSFGDPAHLATPMNGGPRYLHGLPHELAHIVLYRSLAHLSTLPAGWGEGWAVFCSAALAVPRLARLHGPELWPEPYDYLRTEGPRSLLAARNETGDPQDRFVRDLVRLERHLGRRAFAARFRPLLRGFQTADEFADVLSGWFARLPPEPAPQQAPDSSAAPSG